MQSSSRKSKLTLYIGIALVLGIGVGFLLNQYYVGKENLQLAQADKQVQELARQMRPFEQVKNTTREADLATEITRLESEQKLLVNGLLDLPSAINPLTRKKSIDDSLKLLRSERAALTDTLSPRYQEIKSFRQQVVAQKQVVTKARDKKLEWFSLLADIFLRLIKMIVAPLVFTTLVVGVAKLGDIRSVGRIGSKTLLWFIGASLVSLVLGMILVNLFEPGRSMHLELPDANVSTGIDKAALSLKDFFYHVFPASVFEAMAKNEILQIVVFSLFFGVAAAALGDVAKPVVKALDACAHIILKVTGYVMNFAPVAVFGAMAAIIAKQGLGILTTYSIFITEFYFGLLVLWGVLMFAGYIFLRKRVLDLIRRMREPILLAFSTSSSEAAFPKTMLELERFGCKDKIVSFVLPLGYSFNLDGSMMYMTFASLFIAQSYGMHIDFPTQISMLLVLMLTSKGIAGVPRASLVVIAGTLATFNIPEAGIALLLGIDPLLDMGRSATNVVGNSIATAVVSKIEGDLTEPISETN